MSMAQPVYRPSYDPYTPPAPPQPAAPPATAVTPGRDLWADLRPMVTLTFIAACLGLMSVVYLTAFARLTAHGTRISELDKQIAAVEADLQRSRGEITRLTRRDRIEREAPRLGLVQLPAGEVSDACGARAVSYEPLPRQVSHPSGGLIATRN